MNDHIKISFILLGTFFVSFLLVTALTDYVCKLNGFYAQGIADERGLYE